MIRIRLAATLMAVAIVAGLPSVVVAQDEATTPEGLDWALTSYLAGDGVEMIDVPFGIEASLLLQDGIASGSGGCNSFSGSYQIDGGSLRFAEEMTVTLALCEDEVQTVEDAYLASLGDVDGWVIDDGVLELSDDFGDVILTFEVPHILWTAGQMTGLMAMLEGLQSQIDTVADDVVTLRDEVDALNVEKLRERVKTLESENKKVKKRLDALEDGATPQPTPKPGGSTSFSSAEKVLLKGIPSRVSNYCSPLRSGLPKNTKAAVTCQPDTSAVGLVNYYLLEGERAAAAYQNNMTNYNVPSAASDNESCEQGIKSQRQWIGGGWQADGCYRASERAEVRFVDNATDCKKLKVGGSTLQSPAFLITLQGSDKDIERVYGWATKGLDPDSSQLTNITKPIPSTAADSPSCPT